MPKPANAIRLTATVVGTAYAAALYLSGVHIQAGTKQALGYLPTALTFLVTLWDIWLWRLPLLQRLAKRPWISGTWSATLTPTAASVIPPGGSHGPVEAYLMIEQTFWSIGIRQYTSESRSNSGATMWGETTSGSDRTFTYNYASHPRQAIADRSPSHLGTVTLDVVGLRPSTITGDYFTNRYTKGDLTLHLVDRTTDYADFASVQKHCQPAGGASPEPVTPDAQR
jgi:hypothetical protein